jgi:hypothetical protein
MATINSNYPWMTQIKSNYLGLSTFVASNQLLEQKILKNLEWS